MFDEIRQVIREIQAVPDAQRSAAVTTFVFWSIAKMTYYIVLGVVVIVLGRRLIYAALSAWKETQREAP